jgi:glc operon protein GlcG
MAVAVVDPRGTLVYCEKMDSTQTGSAIVAIAKARSAARFKRPTEVFDDAVARAGAGLPVLAVPGAIPVGGGRRKR